MGALYNNSSFSNITAPTALTPRTNQMEELVKTVTFWIIIIVGILGNSLVIAVVKMFRSMRTTTNYLLVNVAVADITTLVFTAILLVLHASKSSSFSSRSLASFLCKFIYTNTIAIVTLLVTALTLTLLAFERYHAMVKPLVVSLRLTADKIAYVIAGIWLVALGLVAPLFGTFDYDPKDRACSHGKANYEMMIYIDCLIGILTLVPFSLIAFCYTQIVYGLYFKKTVCGSKSERRHMQEEIREKRRLVTLLILLTVVFFLAFIPYGILLILKVSKVKHTQLKSLQLASQYLTLLNCSINPLIYAFQSSSYRRAFKLIIKKMFCRDITYELSELLEMRTRTSVRSV